MKNIIVTSRHGTPTIRTLFAKIDPKHNVILCEQVATGYRERKSNGKMTIVKSVNIDPDDTLIRWGARMPLNENGCTVINPVEALSLCSHKDKFRALMMENMIRVPYTVTNATFLDELNYSNGVVIRPHYHRAGKNFHLVNSLSEARAVLAKEKYPMWYASEYINKTQEFRVQYAFGRIVSIKEKPNPNNGIKGPWNFDTNGLTWTYVQWENYKLPVVKEVIKAAKVIGIDICAIDVMVDALDNVYILEINTAPALAEYVQERLILVLNLFYEGKLNKEESLNVDSSNVRNYIWLNKYLNKE
jgi:glutathione synthase/RimK-type ligase-like ATP-grasp enzyme